MCGNGLYHSDSWGYQPLVRRDHHAAPSIRHLQVLETSTPHLLSSSSLHDDDLLTLSGSRVQLCTLPWVHRRLYVRSGL